MRKKIPQIILASRSPHRKKLLKQAGLSFRVIPSRANETSILIKGASHLVKENALLKAQEVAARVKQGIVIGCDTLAFIGKKTIVGKPRNLKEAKRNLKALSRKPQWLYSGLAIIDAKTKKTAVSFEKTKVVMTPLSDKEIDSYYRLVDPRDKAGGFDIEGKGALFIRRIEGCYFNVVGLPLSKLRVMLKKFGVHLLMVLCSLYLGGCISSEYNLATEREETYFISTEKEISLGESIARQVEDQYEVNTDHDINERVTSIARRIE